jgi:hypothetical protein
MVLLSAGTQGLTNTTFAPAGPLLGTIVLESGAAPVLADVVWENGEKSVGLDRDALLIKAENPDEEDELLVSSLGKFVQLTSYPENDDEDRGAPKSPAAAGLVHRAFLTFPDFSGESEPNGAFVVMSWQDGRVKAMVPSPSSAFDDETNTEQTLFGAQPGRRQVGKG